ncbi:hypothetical protein SUGI_0064830 [Cryptomeria japonica]|nr:hypothetical protein SUGI_0064830 [Cryptomeria japonica]
MTLGIVDCQRPYLSLRCFSCSHLLIEIPGLQEVQEVQTTGSEKLSLMVDHADPVPQSIKGKMSVRVRRSGFPRGGNLMSQEDIPVGRITQVPRLNSRVTVPQFRKELY